MPAVTFFPTPAIRRRFLSVAVMLALTLVGLGVASAGEDLPQRVDALIVAAAKDAAIGPVCDDATFVRRVYLDLAGRIPSWNEATTFLASTESNKNVPNRTGNTTACGCASGSAAQWPMPRVSFIGLMTTSQLLKRRKRPR